MKIISIVGSKGGCGQTTIATNLAVALTRKLKQPVGLIDFCLDGSSGDIESILNIQSKKTFADLIPSINQIDSQLLKGYLDKHSSGVNYLKSGLSGNPLTPPSPTRGEACPERSRRNKGEGDIVKFINILRETFPYVTIDLERGFSDTSLTILDESDLVLLVMTPDVLGFNQVKHYIEEFTKHHFPLSILKIVVNMSTIAHSLGKERIKSFLKQDVFFEIPYDLENVLSAVNQGIPVVIKNSRAEFSKAIYQLADLLTTREDLYVSEGKRNEILLPPRRDQNDNLMGQNDKPTELRTGVREMQDTEYSTIATQEIIGLKQKLHKELLQEVDLQSINLKTPEAQKETKESIKTTLEKLIAKEKLSDSIDREQRTQIIYELLDEVLGLGPLEQFLRDPSISEIMVIGTDKIYIERTGKLVLTDKKFASDKQLMTVIERIVAPIGRRVDESMPLCDARLQDGSRVNIVIPPLALDGPMITIRKFSEKKLSVNDLINYGSLSKEMAEFLKICVTLRKNIIVSGGTGSGKTTLLNIISSFISETERIVTIEDSAELKLQQEHVVRLESRPANIEGTGEIPIRKLVINALRMRPDRIVVGECRSGETLDMLQAMNTGHDGSITTVHSNSPRDTLNRIETMVLMSGMELPIRAIREQIKSAIDIIVHQTRFSDGARKIVSITEVTGMEGDIITTQDIFKFQQTGMDSTGKILGEYRATGLIPTFAEESKTKGIRLNLDIFK